MARAYSVTLVLGAGGRYVISRYPIVFRYHLSESKTEKRQVKQNTRIHIARVIEFLKFSKMAKKNLKRKQKTEVVKEDESKVILPLVRRSDEPVTKKV